MNFNLWISLVAATVTAGIAVLALWRDPRSFVHRVFAAGMALFALEAGLSGLAYLGPSADEFLYWRIVFADTPSSLAASAMVE